MALDDIAGYSLRRRLGSGSAGTVWLVRDLASGRHAVLKRIPTPSITDPTAFERDLTTLLSIDHPHIARLIEVRQSDTDWLLFGQHVPAGNLTALLSRRGDLSLGELVTLISPLAEALSVLHHQGLHHGRLTPANILFDAEGRPVITDAALRSQDPTTTPADDLAALSTLTHQAAGTTTSFPATLFTHTNAAALARKVLALAPPTPLNLAFHDHPTPEVSPAPTASRPSTTRPSTAEPPAIQLPPAAPTPTRPTPAPRPTLNLTPTSTSKAAPNLTSTSTSKAAPNPTPTTTSKAAPNLTSTSTSTSKAAPNLTSTSTSTSKAAPNLTSTSTSKAAPNPTPTTTSKAAPNPTPTPSPPSTPRTRRKPRRNTTRRARRDNTTRLNQILATTTTHRAPRSRRTAYGVLAASALAALIVVALALTTLGILDTPTTNPAAASPPSPTPPPTPANPPSSNRPSSNPPSAKPTPASPTSESAPAPPPTSHTWLKTLESLDQRRAHAFFTLNPAELDTVYQPGSSPWTADRAALASYQAQKIRIANLRFHIQHLIQEPTPGPTVTLRVTDRLVSATALTPTGHQSQLPPGPPTTRRITLAPTGKTWRITTITPA